MLKIRVIPCLLLKNDGLVKSVKFKNPTYVGDPINAVKIFNDKEVDELLFIDIEASKKGREPNYDLIARISCEAFMPFGYGGGITTVEQVKKLTRLGVEKVAINAYARKNPDFITQASEVAGSSSVVVSIDIKKDLLGRLRVFDYALQKTTSLDPVEYAQLMESKGAGEIFLNSVDRDGTFSGYDTELIKKVTQAVTVPVVAAGGAGHIRHFADAVKSGASAVAAGSFFIFYGPHRAVLITYPDKASLKEIFR
ncbi:MAG TPA: AglZ/HisF2 family acetamidino modification protein [Bacteroidales bacterium]|nr:imidazole glycerol phosphate synthase subunit HisF [Bacteroidales bacterium]HNZ42951.1 AglZ/HisF2 family acetamidino modification protein [Bacteroidales bacterium]HPB24636.1 AglZ/HisF2 family acetamidino modification protein [Bacteroidales bacterium]HPI29851.1 AglZ/HisF2 family acetamidino modification protein [Bacteroidales bacterium]HQN15110.1 AglZ/HisF2 family acetamidino modification protein [Bacteroidales bacterium]